LVVSLILEGGKDTQRKPCVFDDPENTRVKQNFEVIVRFRVSNSITSIEQDVLMPFSIEMRFICQEL